MWGQGARLYPVCVLTPSSNRTPQPQTEKIAVARDPDLVYLFSKNPLEQAGVSPWLEFVPKRSDEMKFTFMKRLVYLVSGLAGFGLNLAVAGDMPPRGNLLELHSCALYAGGCVVSSEATLEGRYMLRAWNFTSGTFNGTSLSGLGVAVLQSSSDNLAIPESKSGDAVIYLPQGATRAQLDALVAWLKSSQPDFHPATACTRVVPLGFTRSQTGDTFSAGDFISVKASSFARCQAFACGESLWYQPRSVTSLFTVAEDQGSQITEPLLELKWADAGKRSVFLARFGEPVAAKSLYVTLADLCSSAHNPL